jgi:hypothetical protein
MRNTFEDGFSEVQRAAEVATREAAALKSAAAALQKAALTGDITKIRRLGERLSGAAQAAVIAAEGARDAWPFAPEEEVKHLQGAFRDELIESGKQEGIAIFRRDEQLIAYPSIIRIDATGRAVRIDRTRHSGLRPGVLAKVIAARRGRKARIDSARFLEVLYSAYRRMVRHDDLGTTVALARIYELTTVLPWVASDYDRQEFARDLLVLSSSGVRQTRDGSQVSFSGSTAVKSAPRDVLSIVDESGETITFHGVKFMRPKK